MRGAWPQGATRPAEAKSAKRARAHKNEEEEEYDDCSDGVGELQSVLIARITADTADKALIMPLIYLSVIDEDALELTCDIRLEQMTAGAPATISQKSTI